jgi:hypothetical protein
MREQYLAWRDTLLFWIRLVLVNYVFPKYHRLVQHTCCFGVITTESTTTTTEPHSTITTTTTTAMTMKYKLSLLLPQLDTKRCTPGLYAGVEMAGGSVPRLCVALCSAVESRSQDGCVTALRGLTSALHGMSAASKVRSTHPEYWLT